ncbi:MAG: NAD-glutamate dehydrogenase domain-containing protein, partial [Acidimicrobiales bacterium]
MPQLTPADWAQRLRAALSHLSGPDEYIQRAPAAYRERLTFDLAAADLAELAALAASLDDEAGSPDPGTGLGGIHRLVAVVDPGADDGGAPLGSFRLRRYGSRALEISAAIPVLESFGLVVVEELPAHIHLGEHPSDPVTVHVDDFGLHPSARLGVGRFDPQADAAPLVAALEAVVRGWADTDSLNRLVIAAGLDWTEVVVLRAYRRYRQQLGTSLEAKELDDPLVAFPGVARALISYFAARFDPAGGGDSVAARAAVEEELAPVPDLADDVVLRGYLALVDATTRTTFYAHRPRGAGLALKLDGAGLPRSARAPLAVEAFVHLPTVEGVHLRAGPVARGGIRWSDRPADLRTEILELAEAQVKKNAIIIPTGAKGGFVLRSGQPPTREVVQAAYEAFIGELLDLTDN